MYGSVEGRVVLAENGRTRRYYVVGPDRFVLHEEDVSAIARSVRASISPVVERMRERL